jgi:minor histocompatibility antigen H13
MFYYVWCFFGYFIGLVVTIAVMNFTGAAQPALLYLVPACLLTSILPAFLRNEIGALFAYSEEDDKEKEKEKEQKKE